MTQVCEDFIRTREARSDSTDKVYEVRLYSADYPFPVCNCPAYALKRNRNRKGLAGKGSLIPGDCKHVTREMANACTYVHPANLPRLAHMQCPECGRKLVDVESTISIDMGGQGSAVKRAAPTAKAAPKAATAQPAAASGDAQAMLDAMLAAASGQASPDPVVAGIVEKMYGDDDDQRTLAVGRNALVNHLRAAAREYVREAATYARTPKLADGYRRAADEASGWADTLETTETQLSITD